VLVITADDYGYGPAYDAGILEAAEAGAIDAVGVMVLRSQGVDALLACPVELGLHLERFEHAPVDEQLERFAALVGRRPDYVDGHHHCHAAPEVAAAVAGAAARLRIPVRPASDGHRDLLREHGVPAVDRVLGRMSEHEPALPEDLARWREAGADPPGVSEWIVHPGHPDPGAASSYDRGRGEDLELLLALGGRDAWAAVGIERAGPRRALAGD
jgi:predicted glycoside hydrolase/deacetylase ChbG (UPF0249 family)